MGLFNFVKNAGEKLADAVGGLVGIGDANAAEAIQQRVQQQDFTIDGLNAQVNGDTVILSGTANSTADAEKAILVAGNLNGVSKVESHIEIAAADPAPEAQFYTVQSGDTLSKISREFYGDANRYNEIFEANRPMLSHPDKIYPGQSLRIPADKNKAAAA